MTRSSAMAYACLPARGVTFVLWEGFITAGAWRHQAMKIIADPDFPTPLVLGDLRNVTAHNFEKLDIFDNASLLASRVRALPQKLALVTGPRGNEPFQIFRDATQGVSVQIQRFDDLADACAWLGIASDEAQASLDVLGSQLEI